MKKTHDSTQLYDLLPDDKKSDAILSMRAHMIAMKPEIFEDNVQQNSCICVRFGSDDIFAIPYHYAVEICRDQIITPVVHSPTFISGITNWRGKLITVINLAKLFGTNTQYNPTRSDTLIISNNEMIVALSVSHITESKEYNDSEMATSLPMKGTMKQEFITGIIEGVISVLNMQFVIEEIQAEINKWRNV